MNNGVRRNFMKKCKNCSEEIEKDFIEGELCEECAEEADMAQAGS